MKSVKNMLLLLLLSTGSALAAPVPSEQEMQAYLMVYFSDATHSLHMALSRDGYNFTSVNDGLPVVAGDTISEQHGVRDPHVSRGPDGAFYMVLTDLHIFGKEKGFRTTRWERPDKYDWGNNRGIVLMRSDDLIHWTHHVVRIDRLFPEAFGDLGCAWAPEVIYDPQTRRMMVYFTIRPTGKDGSDSRTHLYYAYADEAFTTLTTVPRLLFEFPDPKIQVLDADITPLPDGRYAMTYVAQENPGGIRIAFSDRINGGYQYQPGQIDAERTGCEAPNVWKRIGEEKWVLMYDIYSIHPHNFGFMETTDFKTFTPTGHFNEGVMRALNFQSPKHGAVIQLTRAEADRLERYWKERPKRTAPYVRTVPLDSIVMSDPAILADSATQMYYLTGTGGQLYMSRDLAMWTGPYDVTDTDPYSWMGRHPMIWAAELHRYNGKYYCFATFTNRGILMREFRGHPVERRASHVLVSEKPYGPYRPMADPIYLPIDRPTLDGTFWVDRDGQPYMVYCGEWLENGNGTIEKIRLKPDLSGTVGEPKVLFHAFDSPWNRSGNPSEAGPHGENQVTDGPFLFRTGTGRLGMIWSSWVNDKYTQGVAYSKSGTLDGPWIQEKKPVTPPDFGHGMLFRTLDGRWMMSVHRHNEQVGARKVRVPHLFEVDLSGDKLRVGKMVR